MHFVSTRNADHRATLSETLTRGLAPDGGLYVPASFPAVDPMEAPSDAITDIAAHMLAPYFEGDPLAPMLDAICADTFSFPVPLRDLGRDTAVLELFHGPTAAFKDVGARFLASALSHLNKDAAQPITILVATSGDTGAAVAAAFHEKPNVEVVVCYPKGRVSARQEKQLTGWDQNVRTLAVNGDFDDCQRLVKGAFQDEVLSTEKRLSSANSINVGRLLPQLTYYAAASRWYVREHNVSPGFIVPSGNLGNAVAALYARAMGSPMRPVAMATNENRPVVDFLETGNWTPKPTQETLATAMDVGDPSNMERLRHHWPTIEGVRSQVEAERIADDEIERQIRRGLDVWDTVWDPHTATAAAVREQRDTPHWVLVATAHPAKFDTVVEPLIGETVPVPEALQAVMERSTPAPLIEPTMDAFREAVLAG
ncbi:MAG: threonine synthase [Bacteroidota bacterium]